MKEVGFTIFNPDGKYNSKGTWKWLNNSDSMEIDDPPLAAAVWYFKYITETEMECGSEDLGYYIYTTTK